MTYKNIAYSPEAFGLTDALDVDKSSGCYEFDQFIIWRTDSGDYCWAEDAGCSCPEPFGSVDLSNVRRGSAKDAYTDALAWVGVSDPGYNETYWRNARSKIEAWGQTVGAA